MLFNGDTFEHRGLSFRFNTQYDHDMGPPWKEHDGHGPVREVRIPDYLSHPPKRPGERVLWTDRWTALLYDFAEAIKIAKRDGWGWLPGKLELSPPPANHEPYTTRGGSARCGDYFAGDPDNINVAIRSVYEQHRASMTPGEYVAGAVEKDFERLRGWANDQWHWTTVQTTLLDAEGNDTDEWDTLGGVEDDDDSYLEQVARELADEIVARIGEETTELVIPERRIALR